MRDRFNSLLLLALAALTVGCGGGGGSSASSGSGGSGITGIGALSATADYLSDVKHFTSTGGNALVFAVFGSNFTRAVYTPTKTLGNTRIAVTATQGGLYTIAPDGSNLQQLGSGFQPNSLVLSNWTPGAKSIIFASYIAGKFGFYRMAPSDARFVPIPLDKPLAFSPVCSPDGTTLAFTFFDGNGNYQIETSPIAGGTTVPLTSGNQSSRTPQWSPDGKKIAFIRNGEIWTMNANGTSVSQLTSTVGSIYDMAWGPDGKRFAVAAVQGNIGQLGVLFAAYPNAIQFITSAASDCHYPSWSPDGRSIAYVVNPNGQPSQVHVTNETGSSDLTVGVGMTFPSWSPYQGPTAFLGSGGTFGASASGIFFTQVGESLGSMVTFASPVPNSVALAEDGAGGNNVGFQLSSPSGITSFKYANDPIGAPTVVVPVGATTSVPGVLFSIDKNTGHVILTAPFIESHRIRNSGGESFEGKFLGIYDPTGKNLAPTGARTIVLEPGTGKLLMHR